MEEEEGLADLEVENFRESVAYIFQDWVGQGMDLDYDQAVQRVQRLAGRALAGHEEGWGQQEQQTWAQDAWGRAGELGAGGQGERAPGQVSGRQVLEGVG